MHVDDDDGTAGMFEALYRWALSLRDLGELSGAQSAAQSLCREARTHAEHTRAGRLLAELYLAGGDLAACRGVRRHLVDLAHAAVVAYPTTEHRLELLTALDQLGELARLLGDARGVLECYGYQGRMAVLAELSSIHGDRASLLTEKCFSLRRAGSAARELGAYEEARALFEERLTMARLTFAGDPTDRQLVALVAAALRDLGSLLARLSDPGAGALLSEDLQLRQWLQATQPQDPSARQELAQSHLVMTAVGADTAEHIRVATILLTQMETEGSLDVTGQMMLSGLRRH